MFGLHPTEHHRVRYFAPPDLQTALQRAQKPVGMVPGYSACSSSSSSRLVRQGAALNQECSCAVTGANRAAASVRWHVPGVVKVDVSFEEHTAVVTFDDAQTDVATLTAATAGNGYPSHLAEASGG